MGVLKWLFFPITAPVSGTMWVGQQVLEEAERQYYDEAAIRQEMLELERSYEQGDVEEAAFEELSERLLQRLLEAQTRRAERTEG